MIREWIPGGYKLGSCPGCRHGEKIEMKSRAQYEAYHEWQDGKLTGRCQHCGFVKTVFIGRGRSYEAAQQRLIYEWDQERRRNGWNGC